jgi:hypothetical protein
VSLMLAVAAVDSSAVVQYTSAPVYSQFRCATQRIGPKQVVPADLSSPWHDKPESKVTWRPRLALKGIALVPAPAKS